MDFACYGSPDGPLVSPEEFMEKAGPRYKKRNIYPYCKACKQVVDPYGVHSTNVDSRFDHKDLRSDEDHLDDCILAKRNPRFKGLQFNEFDDVHGNTLRSQFFQDEQLRTAYAFMWKLCGKGNFPTEKFNQCILRADRKTIWSYKDIPLWVIPYILLTFENFINESRGYGFHFVIKKPSKTLADALWLRPERCRLLKVFSDTGRKICIPEDAFISNPLPFSGGKLTEIAGDTAWIKDYVLSKIRHAK